MEHSDIMIIVGVSVGVAVLVIVVACIWILWKKCRNCKWQNDSDDFGYRTQVDDDVERQANNYVTRSSSRSRSTQPTSSHAVSPGEQQRHGAHHQQHVTRQGTTTDPHRAGQRLPQQQTLEEFYKQQQREWQFYEQQQREWQGRQAWNRNENEISAGEQQRRVAHQQQCVIREGTSADPRGARQQIPQQQTLKESHKQQKLYQWIESQAQHWNENEIEDVPDSRRQRNVDKTLDLHSFYLREAMQAFILFLKENESIYQNSGKEADRFVYIITGRGLHSKDGIPKIKPAVQNYLNKHKYTQSWENAGGMVTVDFLASKRSRSNQ